MKTFTTTLVALTALAAASGPAFAFSEAGVTQVDIARVSSQVSQIADANLRAQARNLVQQAQDALQDENDGHAAFALDKALDLVRAP